MTISFQQRVATRIGAKWGGGNNLRGVTVTTAFEGGEPIAYREGPTAIWRSMNGARLEDAAVLRRLAEALRFRWRQASGAEYIAPSHAFERWNGGWRSLCGAVSRVEVDGVDSRRPEERHRCKWCDGKEMLLLGEARRFK